MKSFLLHGPQMQTVRSIVPNILYHVFQISLGKPVLEMGSVTSPNSVFSPHLCHHVGLIREETHQLPLLPVGSAPSVYLQGFHDPWP